MNIALRDRAATRGLTIATPAGKETPWSLTAPVDAAALQAELWHEGYFVGGVAAGGVGGVAAGGIGSGPSLPPALVARCRDAIELVLAAGAPPLAAFAFDAPWQLGALLAEHAAAAFDGEPAMLPAFWAWCLVDEQGRGWEPHRDRPKNPLDDRGAPLSITLWAALTDATTQNGCIHVLPAPLDLQYGNPHATNEILHVQCVRALPAPAGTVLGWTSALLHWGGVARAGHTGRTSIAFEWQRADRPPPDEPTFPRGWIPAPAKRRALILRQWAQYEHMHELPDAQRAALTAVLDALLPA